MIGNKALSIALTQLNVREATNHNDGPAVEGYLKAVGLNKGYSWCMAFIYWCTANAAKELMVSNPLKRTGSVMEQWNWAVAHHLSVTDPQPGDIFIIDRGNGKGHTGFVTAVRGEWLDTVEGNTNSAGSHDGDGVYTHTRNKSAMKGYIRV
ncbi:CHAP domain-containing protein [Chitinophaga sp. Cy-1792]|uniref:CHAP domain-containing protein n=1 Tax=Chitinophaga sp. Cy-1792 TaxID=2608339 RepID=UPI001423C77E|nr:CHAP domain-containing protein [Chitinophaga sp. Cy-1792]NIG56445.1 CHAP domain-containing protein [Chitinophaga sp. Cy-1792]